MATTISGVWIKNLSISNKEDKVQVTGTFSLMSNKGKALGGQQAFNEFETIKVDVPLDATRQMLAAVEKALSAAIGLEEDET